MTHSTHAIRNVALIAHVDHGKTTLVDALLRQSKTKLRKEVSDTALIMDSNELERERGITIFSKNASVRWEGVKINIIDTPGHADFGGEVERVLTMADGSLLLVDAKEGPMPQTRFVLKKALSLGHRIIVIINKIDRPDERHSYALDRTFDLFVSLGADDATLDFPVLYASAKEGKAGPTPDLAAMTDITPVFTSILRDIPPAPGDVHKPLQVRITAVGADPYKGRIATGRIQNGSVSLNERVVHCTRSGERRAATITSVMTFEGLQRVEIPKAVAGDLVALAGIPDVTIGETIVDQQHPEPLPLLRIEEPTVRMTFSVNNSPFAGTEGQYSTSRQLRERLLRELETDLALRIEDGPHRNWIVSGRGELHLAIFIERLRREGYELQVARPQVIPKRVNGDRLVPYEHVEVDVPESMSGTVIQKLGKRHGTLRSLLTANGRTQLAFVIPTQGLFGYRREFLTDTRGLGTLYVSFLEYGQDFSAWHERDQGSLVAHESGTTNTYGLLNVQDRGVLFYGSGVPVYRGQVVGQHARSGDLRVNVCKAKQLSNMRSKGEGSSEHSNAPFAMDLENALEYLGEDELVEVTPKSVRIRKLVLDPQEERRRVLGIIR